LLLLSDKDFCQIANGNLATLDHQIISKNLAISIRRTKSNDLVIKEAKSLAIKMTHSNAGDVMLMSSSQRQGDKCHVLYSTPPTKNLLKTTYTIKTQL
jgi:hypothetical protein